MSKRKNSIGAKDLARATNPVERILSKILPNRAQSKAEEEAQRQYDKINERTGKYGFDNADLSKDRVRREKTKVEGMENYAENKRNDRAEERKRGKKK